MNADTQHSSFTFPLPSVHCQLFVGNSKLLEVEPTGATGATGATWRDLARPARLGAFVQAIGACKVRKDQRYYVVGHLHASKGVA